MTGAKMMTSSGRSFGKLLYWAASAGGTLYALNAWTDYARHKWIIYGGHLNEVFQFDIFAGQVVIVGRVCGWPVRAGPKRNEHSFINLGTTME